MKKIVTLTIAVWLAVQWSTVAADQSAPAAGKDSCLLFSAKCLAKGTGNFFLYQTFSHQKLLIRKGDVLEYSEYLDTNNPENKVALDVGLDGGPLRDIAEVKDQDGHRVHADDVVAAAVGQWHARKVNLDPVAGKNAQSWMIAFEGDKYGRYVAFLRDVAVRHADGTSTVIYKGGMPACSSTENVSNYSRHVVVLPAPLEAVTDDATRQKVIQASVLRAECQERLEMTLAGVALAAELIKTQSPQAAELLRHIEKAKQVIADAEGKAALDQAVVDAAQAEITRELKPIQEFVRQWTGHLVGHAHIDMMWLWEYPETVAEFGKTFGSAVKFLEEVPDFKFSQSSSSFYQETEASHPALFEKIKKYVAEGRWELVGGRVCEGDTNIMSAEAHARQFLYGQRFFRERFGKEAVVGWEPDTFGHTRQMPQILKLGGCKYYYFCRSANGRTDKSPLFWWSAPEGSRVLAFDQAANGGWYNDRPLDKTRFAQMGSLSKATGSKDAICVYGVGNHGGGPTRENINTANEWKKEPYLPKVKFSTAQEFFEAQAPEVLAKLPVINDELNAVFEGCYTTHGDIKRWNNDSEAVMVSAETAAAVAARLGFDYPGLQIRQNWEDICWNHHHDTIDGSAINASYKKSKRMLEKVIASGHEIGADATVFLASKATAGKGDLLVFNPLGFERDDVLELQLPAGFKAKTIKCGAELCAVQRLGENTGKAVVAVHKLPSVGYQTYTSTSSWLRRAPAAPTVTADGAVLENANLKVTLDPKTGMIRSLFDKRQNRECVTTGKTANRLEVHYENQRHMAAWEIGSINHVDIMDSPVELKVVEKGPVRATVEFTRKVVSGTVTQRMSLSTGGDSLVCSLNIDWKETGARNKQLPFLKVAFDWAVEKGKAVCETPFGAIERPCNGNEDAALKWVDLGNPSYGISLINDCKHGYSVKDGTVRLSLVRTSSYPDSTADNYLQTVRYEIYPHTGDWNTAGTINRAFAFVHPLFTAWLSHDGAGKLPTRCSFVKPMDDRVIVTAVKRAEDDNDLVVRMYEPSGKEVATVLKTWWPVFSGTQVNFVEEVIPGKVAPATDGAGVSLKLQGNEIQTLKLNLKTDASIPLKGTRGPTPVRPF